MAKQGSTLDFSIDLTTIEPFDSIKIEVYNEVDKSTILTYKYPVISGFETITKLGSIYSFTISSTQSALMLGIYGFEITKIIGTKEYLTEWDGSYLEITPQAK